MRREHSVVVALVSFVFFVYRGYRMTLDTSDGLTVQQNQMIGLAIFGVIIITAVWSTLARTRHARAGARRLRLQHPDARVTIVRGDDYFLGSIAQLRPDLSNPMKLGRWQVLAVLPDRFEVWGGRGGDELLLRVPWHFVRSVSVDDIKEWGTTVAALIIILHGAEITPLRLALHMRGVAIQYPMSQQATNRFASAMKALREHAPDAVTERAGGGTGVR